MNPSPCPRTISEDGTIQRTPLIATLPQMDGSYLTLQSEGYIGIVDRRAWEDNSEQILADIAPVAVVIKVRSFNHVMIYFSKIIMNSNVVLGFGPLPTIFSSTG